MPGEASANSTQQGAAGRFGDDVRSDLRVVLEPRDAGGIEIELQSRVKVLYGRAIETQVRGLLATLGISNARLSIQDRGALPYATAARIEAAVRRAGLARDRRALPEAVPLPAPSLRDRLRRSRLYLPGNDPKLFINAGLHGADAIILDLEDSVHPGEKDAARILVRNALRAVSFGTSERMVRINQLPLGLADLDEVVPEHPDLVLIPKVERPEQVNEIDAVVERILGRRHSDRPIWLMPILESALGIENATAIAIASKRIVAIALGAEDYTADLGVVKTKAGDETAYARQRLVN